MEQENSYVQMTNTIQFYCCISRKFGTI